MSNICFKNVNLNLVLENVFFFFLIVFILLFLFSVGVFKNGRVEIIANDQGNRITPSYVAFTAEGERLIGDAAKNQLTTNPENTIFDAKRLIGRDWNEPTVQKDIKFFPFKVIFLNCFLFVVLFLFPLGGGGGDTCLDNWVFEVFPYTINPLNSKYFRSMEFPAIQR